MNQSNTLNVKLFNSQLDKNLSKIQSGRFTFGQPNEFILPDVFAPTKRLM